MVYDPALGYDPDEWEECPPPDHFLVFAPFTRVVLALGAIAAAAAFFWLVEHHKDGGKKKDEEETAESSSVHQRLPERQTDDRAHRQDVYPPEAVSRTTAALASEARHLPAQLRFDQRAPPDPEPIRSLHRSFEQTARANIPQVQLHAPKTPTAEETQALRSWEEELARVEAEKVAKLDDILAGGEEASDLDSHSAAIEHLMPADHISMGSRDSSQPESRTPAFVDEDELSASSRLNSKMEQISHGLEQSLLNEIEQLARQTHAMQEELNRARDSTYTENEMSEANFDPKNDAFEPAGDMQFISMDENGAPAPLGRFERESRESDDFVKISPNISAAPSPSTKSPPAAMSPDEEEQMAALCQEYDLLSNDLGQPLRVSPGGELSSTGSPMSPLSPGFVTISSDMATTDDEDILTPPAAISPSPSDVAVKQPRSPEAQRAANLLDQVTREIEQAQFGQKPLEGEAPRSPLQQSPQASPQAVRVQEQAQFTVQAPGQQQQQLQQQQQAQQQLQQQPQGILIQQQPSAAEQGFPVEVTFVDPKASPKPADLHVQFAPQPIVEPVKPAEIPAQEKEKLDQILRDLELPAGEASPPQPSPPLRSGRLPEGSPVPTVDPFGRPIQVVTEGPEATGQFDPYGRPIAVTVQLPGQQQQPSSPGPLSSPKSFVVVDEQGRPISQTSQQSSAQPPLSPSLLDDTPQTQEEFAKLWGIPEEGVNIPIKHSDAFGRPIVYETTPASPSAQAPASPSAQAPASPSAQIPSTSIPTIAVDQYGQPIQFTEPQQQSAPIQVQFQTDVGQPLVQQVDQFGRPLPPVVRSGPAGTTAVTTVSTTPQGTPLPVQTVDEFGRPITFTATLPGASPAVSATIPALQQQQPPSSPPATVQVQQVDQYGRLVDVSIPIVSSTPTTVQVDAFGRPIQQVPATAQVQLGQTPGAAATFQVDAFGRPVPQQVGGGAAPQVAQSSVTVVPTTVFTTTAPQPQSQPHEQSPGVTIAVQRVDAQGRPVVSVGEERPPMTAYDRQDTFGSTAPAPLVIVQSADQAALQTFAPPQQAIPPTTSATGTFYVVGPQQQTPETNATLPRPAGQLPPDELRNMAEAEMFLQDAIEYVNNQPSANGQNLTPSGFVMEEEMLSSHGEKAPPKPAHAAGGLRISEGNTSQLVKTNDVFDRIEHDEIDDMTYAPEIQSVEIPPDQMSEASENLQDYFDYTSQEAQRLENEMRAQEKALEEAEAQKANAQRQAAFAQAPHIVGLGHPRFPSTPSIASTTRTGTSAGEAPRLRKQSSLLSVLGVTSMQEMLLTIDSLEALSAAMRKAGLESTNLIFGIDYTASNKYQGEESFGGHSLHTIHPNIKNPYQQVITILGRTLAPFTSTGKIPVYGFGDAKTCDWSVFPLKDDGNCSSLEEVLKTYNEVTPTVELSGPTNFSPLIYQAIEICQKTMEYHILVIIADGQVTNEKATRRAIVQACQYPLSIIVVGVGDGPWEMMRVFDESLPKRAWDNFHFVEFHDVIKRAQAGSDADVKVAVQSLLEIPDQYRCVCNLGLLRGRYSPRMSPRRVDSPRKFE